MVLRLTNCLGHTETGNMCFNFLVLEFAYPLRLIIAFAVCYLDSILHVHRKIRNQYKSVTGR